MTSYLYVASDGETSKIGVSGWPQLRMATLSDDAENRYRAIKLWKSNKATVLALEKEVVECMSNYCSKGREWFSVPSHRLITVVEGIIKRRSYNAVEAEMPKPDRSNTFSFDLPEPFRGMAEDICDIRSKQQSWRGRKVMKAEAIRYAIAFTHKQLTEVLNVEDLSDD